MAEKIIATNRKARFNYAIIEAFEAGIELKGTEVKSIRSGHVSLNDSFARSEGSEIFLYNMYIAPYEFGNRANVDSMRPRKLLLHRNEIARLIGEITAKRLTLVPLKVYFKNGIVKVELSVAKGKRSYDKREAIKKRESDRELKRISRHRL
ncbi:MAG: SsrA-binding protein SmpB [Candidatus Omnitrophota bacterium]|nr:SsrA-binding protein SmpB [Candidatus Omnitrophota bacterium]